jgi:hypothetical protein
MRTGFVADGKCLMSGTLHLGAFDDKVWFATTTEHCSLPRAIFFYPMRVANGSLEEGMAEDGTKATYASACG